MFKQMQTAALRHAFVALKVPPAHRAVHSSTRTRPYFRSRLLWGSALAFGSAFALGSGVHLDAPDLNGGDTRADPATSIEFPKELIIPSKFSLPSFTLVGVGVRTVSFLGIKVYSIGFYADLSNPNLNISKAATPEEKIEHVVRNTACVIRIVPTRSTSYSHLRDGFMRALQGRMRLLQQRDALTKEEEIMAQAPLRKFKSLFPNTPLAKHTPLDILLTAPSPSEPRSLVIRDLGTIQDDWVAREFVLAYFEGHGLSPPLKQSVKEALESFGK